MYSIKPGGKAYLVGSTIGSLALGIGMRWRETVVEVIERHSGPQYEAQNRRRIVIPNSAVTLLNDLGVPESILHRHLRPARRWKITNTHMNTLRDGDVYPGCAPAEPVFHTTEGQLMRLLRTQFLRFGGTVSWDTTAYDPFEAEDGTGKWFMRKEYGPATDAEVILSWSKTNSHFKKEIFAPDPNAIGVLFDVKTGYCARPIPDLVNFFGNDYDVIICVGATLALHMWRPDRTITSTSADAGGIAWRCIGKGRTDNEAQMSQLHPLLRTMMEQSTRVVGSTQIIPGTTPTFRNDMQHVRISVCGDSMLPVDPFEWRGDRAQCEIQEASHLIRAFYDKKYSRGHVPEQLRNFEQDALARRASLLRRDLQDAEMFLDIRPELPRDDDDDVLLKRVGAS